MYLFSEHRVNIEHVRLGPIFSSEIQPKETITFAAPVTQISKKCFFKFDFFLKNFAENDLYF